MIKPPKLARPSRFRESRLPVLTEEVDGELPAAEPPVHLAWDNSRLPVLTEVIEDSEPALRRRALRGRA